MLTENKALEEKIEQLIDIMKQQSKELREMESTLNKLEQANSSLNKQNSSYNEELITKGKLLNKLENDKNHFHSLLQEKIDLLNFEKSQLEQIRSELDKSNKKLSALESSSENNLQLRDEIVSYVIQR
jgi:chromosome segregation ATPase